MKFNHTLVKLLVIGALSVSQTSCNKMLDLTPLDQLSDASYWKSANDFMLAANAFYTYQRTFNDVVSDQPHADLRGDIMAGQNAFSRGLNTVPTTDGSYNTAYSRIRTINYLLNKAQTYPTPADIKKYVAEAKYFRAYVYFDLLQLYGGVPIIDKLLAPDSPELQAPRNSRDEVADFIIKNLNEAIADLPGKADQTAAEAGRVNKESAQSFLSRVALFEGTWQKFRDNASRANTLLDIAVSSSGAVISGGKYSLFAPATLGDSAQKYMFILENQKSNPANIQKSANNEYILANRYDQTLRQIRLNVTHSQLGADLSGNFVNLYLAKDGLPIEKSPLFKGYATMKSEFENRDNRMRYNMMIADGYYWKGNANWRIDWTGGAADRANAFTSPFKPYSNGVSGYHNQKWGAERQVLDNEEGYDYPVIRYAEVLLNYAEAVYERTGTISDADLDKSLNLVRQRVNKSMPKLSNAFVQANGLDMREEIRRERTIELYLEGFRVDDLKRWHNAHEVLKKPVTGIRWKGTEFEKLWPAQANVAKDANGAVIVDANRSFSEKNYLLPIPTQQIQLNPKLEQNPGW
ncbi:RagB/SusD family nutrient uptake outer membrane protein [Arsenicibacter rosenii]|uniref:RagB/SusD family nutrient uptake outer membrane protein n=1 Tax=Arsenicibacter rosenii TaxID=1750698 RepID=A0A1S2VFV6_9BACT|nr:RagB/SusD family nutrient uptake outer membrane protein [Arsenicibacter rosenii]OIN57300.1 RagB/SusD family nutrient uptake outer membrane protein [Arsenicibacter rosenii]